MTPNSSEPWEQLVALFEEGAITAHEFGNRLFDFLTIENVWEVGKQIKKEYFDLLVARLPELPEDDEGWSKMRSFSMGCYTGPVAADDFSTMRRGVEVFRRFCLIPSKAQRSWKCLCYLCFPEAVEYGELVPGLYLIRDGDVFGLMCQPGHRGDYILLFPEKPTPDPDPECVHVDDEIAKESDRWVDVVSEWMELVKMTPHEGYLLVQSCLDAGWKSSKDGHMLFWLFGLAGQMLKGEHVLVSREEERRPVSGESGAGTVSEAVEQTHWEDEVGMVGPEGAD